ncbi:Lon protease C-terminal proteolytic domain-containing protein [Dipodascopsis uninucleata]
MLRNVSRSMVIMKSPCYGRLINVSGAWIRTGGVNVTPRLRHWANEGVYDSSAKRFFSNTFVTNEDRSKKNDGDSGDKSDNNAQDNDKSTDSKLEQQTENDNKVGENDEGKSAKAKDESSLSGSEDDSGNSSAVATADDSKSVKDPGNDNTEQKAEESNSGEVRRLRRTRKKAEAEEDKENKDDSKEPAARSRIRAKRDELVDKTASFRKLVPDFSTPAPSNTSKNGSGIPDEVPELMALPIVSRPLFPGFYKAVVLHDERHIEAVQELVRRGQPWVGVFMNREASPKTELILDPDEIYRNGVFAQITSIFPQTSSTQKEGLTIVLYPHRRIEIEDFMIAPADAPPIIDPSLPKSTESDVTSFDTITPEDESPMAFLKDKVTMVKVKNRPDDPVDKQEPAIRAVVSEIISLLKEISGMNPLFRDQITAFTLSLASGNVFDEPVRLSDFAAAVSAGETTELQELIDTKDIGERLQKGLVLLKKELMNAKLQSKINKDVESKIQKRQREYYLMEQMRGIRRELGLESDGKDKMIERFKERADKLNMPEAVRRVFDEEMNKMMNLEPSSSEFNVTRNYLDWITQLPWGIHSPENFSIKHAMQVLEDDHYGLKDVKDRILEFIAVGKLRGTVDGKILCFVGPPGVGKTSIGKSIARALDRQFQRFSVGGLTDVAEIKGHRRTYVGALPGRIIQSLKKSQTENPLILIDEVDKIGRGHQGDPASALLELLDPEQNHAFLDHYMDVPVDLSKVLFVCTANTTDTIPTPLLDRMEVIEVSGYIAEEKKAIALKYLAPQARKQSGLENVDVELTSDAVDTLIRNYCRESGVRNLKQQIEKVYRKSAYQIVKELKEDEKEPEFITTATQESNAEEATAASSAPSPNADAGQFKIKPLEVPKSISLKITPENLSDFVGPPIYTSDKLYDLTPPPPGVITGLAWTTLGGKSMYVESVLETSISQSKIGSGSFKWTGMLGEVMRESSMIAYTFARMYVSSHFPLNRFFELAKIHMHCPEGATPKDGPSAGVTIATSLLSLALNKPVDPCFAMTGEITVTGRVLRIGGLREKCVAAKRAGATTVFFPSSNKADWDALPENIREGLEGVPCHYYDDIFRRCFEGISREQGNTVWADQIKDEQLNDTDKEKRAAPISELFPSVGNNHNEIHM